MYSFNLDYIFNIVYNIFLAIRYVILFWILGIDKQAYLIDHQNDAWDGLRDRGWITLDQSASSGNNVIYLGNGETQNASWWDTIKHNIFGINKNNVGFAADQTNSNSLFSHLKFSIQNPILAFFADILSVLTFFALLLFLYSFLKWLSVTLPAKNKKEDKKEIVKEVEEKKEIRKIEIEELKPKEEIISVEERKIIVKEERVERSMPAGIAGLPIDEGDLTQEEVEDLDRKEDILLDYKIKNIIPKKENQVLKVKNYTVDYSSREEVEDRKEEIFKAEREKWYKERWNIVVGYMEGKEEALWRIGILEADNLLDELLLDRGYFGMTLADKLKQANFNSIDLAWNAHKMRNRIAHDGSKFVLTDRMARSTLEMYRTVFKEFKIFE
jgi:hypothetical protein